MRYHVQPQVIGKRASVFESDDKEATILFITSYGDCTVWEDGKQCLINHTNNLGVFYFRGETTLFEGCEVQA
jgi:hypothetical protein